MGNTKRIGMNKKLGRNDKCPCDSGLKYKYCCIRKDLKPRNIKVDENCSSCGSEMTIDMSNDLMNHFASSRLPIKNFCKDNDIYFFGLGVTVGQADEIDKKLNSQTLSKKDIIETYKTNFRKEPILGLLDVAIEEMSIFEKRKEILKDAFEAHFEEKYTLTIPTLFAQLEGLLRDVGNLKNKDNIKPTISVDIWDAKLAFPIKDDAQFFNGFIHKLFEGSKDADSFNRNPILHGFKVDYFSEEHSILIILSILEIRLFDWWSKNLPKYTFKSKKE